MFHVYSIDGITPVVHPSAYVHPSAILIGDVIIGADCYVGPGASLRGDFGRIILEQGANIQDTCVMHSYPNADAIIEVNGHIGHGVILHGCRIGKNSLIGMNAVVMDNVTVGSDCIVGAMSFVKSGMQIPSRSLVMGIPGKVVRAVTDEELEWKQSGTQQYHQLTKRSLMTMQRVNPLTEVEPTRKRFDTNTLMGVHSFKAK